LEKEISEFLKEESIELLILGEEDQMAQSLLRIISKIPVQIFQVKEQNNVSYL